MKALSRPFLRPRSMSAKVPRCFNLLFAGAQLRLVRYDKPRHSLLCV